MRNFITSICLLGSLALLVSPAAISGQELDTKQATNAPISTGDLTAQFTRYADQAKYPEVIRRMVGEAESDEAEAQLAQKGDARHTVNLRGETYEIYIPAHYDGSKPFGLFVYISPLESGAPPKSFVRSFDKHDVIFVGANRSGNSHDVLARRIPLALHAVHNMTAQYQIDPNRVYVGGISGGAKVAGFLGVSYGDYFTGAMHIVASEPVATGKILLPQGALAAQVKNRNRYVFVTGQHDFNRKAVRKHARNYRDGGFTNVELIDIRGMGHTAPSGKNFERALKFMDGDGG